MLGTIPIGSGGRGLLSAAQTAVRKLASAGGVKLPTVSSPSGVATATGGPGEGGGRRAAVNQMAIIVFALAAVALTGLTIRRTLRRRRAPRRRTSSRRRRTGLPASVSPTQYVELAIIFAFVAWGLYRLLLRQHGYFTYFVIALAVLWEGLSLIPILRDGFVLINLPPFLARTATMLCLACGTTILLLAFSLAELPERNAARTRPTTDELDPDDLDEAWEIG
jgi:hypothetical protein